jgi:hypothetical protein
VLPSILITVSPPPQIFVVLCIRNVILNSFHIPITPFCTHRSHKEEHSGCATTQYCPLAYTSENHLVWCVVRMRDGGGAEGGVGEASSTPWNFSLRKRIRGVRNLVVTGMVIIVRCTEGGK